MHLHLMFISPTTGSSYQDSSNIYFTIFLKVEGFSDISFFKTLHKEKKQSKQILLDIMFNLYNKNVIRH